MSPLVIEVVSTNWSDDYALKFEEYENIGIPEYLIVDYLGLGGKKFIGNPKLPTITLCQLENSEYKSILYQGDEVRDFQLKKDPKIFCSAGILPVNDKERAGCPSHNMG